MAWDQFVAALPDYADDLRRNIETVMRQPELTPEQTWGVALASAIAARSPALLREIEHEASRLMSSNSMHAARTAAALMGMNNVYFRFVHLAENDRYGEIPSRLRMNGNRTHGAHPADYELYALAVSAVNGCGACIVAHERVLRRLGITEEAIAAAGRIAAVIHGIAAVADTRE